MEYWDMVLGVGCWVLVLPDSHTPILRYSATALYHTGNETATGMLPYRSPVSCPDLRVPVQAKQGQAVVALPVPQSPVVGRWTLSVERSH